METTTASTSLADAQRAYAIFGRVVAGVRPEQLGDPTPCTEWDVRALVNHIIGAHFYFTGALRGEEMDMSQPLPDFAAGDPVATFQQASSGMLEAWREPGALDRTVTTLMGPMPATMLIGMFTNDNLVHAWDLARATGQDENLDPDLARQLLGMMQAVSPPRGSGYPFQAEQPAPAGATPEQELAAYLGRKV